MDHTADLSSLEDVLERVLERHDSRAATLIEGVREEVHGLRGELRELSVKHEEVTTRRLEALEKTCHNLSERLRLVEQDRIRQSGAAAVVWKGLPWVFTVIAGGAGAWALLSG